jgi:hypothetical protein
MNLLLFREELLEWLLSIVLIAYISFSECISHHPGRTLYRTTWETQIGTALRLVALTFVAKYVSMLAAIFFMVNLLRCSDLL